MMDMVTQDAAPRGPLVTVPLYRAPHLIAPLFASLAAMSDELAAIDARVLLIDDSPGDDGLTTALAEHLPALAAACDAALVINDGNIGFVRTANRALAYALKEGRDAILLNSDALPVPGAFREMVAVAAADPTAGAVSPRSDNATICNSPYPDALRPDPATALAGHRVIQRYLPPATAVPTAVGFCLLVRHAMIARFGGFDEAYGGGYNEENDFIRRINRHGFRAVLANRAYVYHLGSVSFAASDESRTTREIANRLFLDARYPEYGPAIARWFEGAEYRAQRLLSGLIPDPDGRLRLTFDCRNAGDGTLALVARFAERHAERWRVRLLGAASVEGTQAVDEEEARVVPSAVAYRIGAPLAIADVVSLSELAPVTGVLFADASPLDRAVRDEHGVATVWQATADTVALLAFADPRTRERFYRDIAPMPDTIEPKHEADALAPAFELALDAIDIATLRCRQARIAVHAAPLRTIEKMGEALALERAAVANERASAEAELASAQSLAAHLGRLLAAPTPAPPVSRLGRPMLLDLRGKSDPDAIVARLLAAPPQPLRVRFGALAHIGGLTQEDAARLLLAAAGRTPVRLAVRRREIVAEAVVANDWRLLLPGPPADADFARLAILAAFGREAEAAELARATEALATSLTREALLGGLLRSPERRRAIAERL
jgi:GT2 family glycosyltransferase